MDYGRSTLRQAAGLPARASRPDLCIVAEVISFQQALGDYILGTEWFM